MYLLRESARKIIHLMGELMGGMMNKKKFSEEFTEYDKVVDGVKPDDHYETFEGRFETGGLSAIFTRIVVGC